ncbi:MAG TPA: iron-sulfur cluster assembly scaffold protein [Bellilinea sp.]|nr:iron-sulfur cluster assembly scaffold protein [Bellilinea sp.]
MDDLYRQEIIDRYKNPSNRGELNPHDFSYEDENPLCGDHLKIDLLVDEQGIVSNAKFSGHGCAISQASVDLLLDEIIGQPLSKVRDFSKDDMLDLLGVEVGPVRLKCALLGLKVLKAGAYGLGENDKDLI